MFTGDRLNDEYEMHQRRFAHITKDDIDSLMANVRIGRPCWYNSILAQIGDGLITAGRSIKEQNAGVNSSDYSVSMR